MKCWLILVCVAASSLARKLEGSSREWIQFKSHHSKTYSHPMEELYRMKIYLDNKRKIEEHNEKHSNGEVSFKLKMNKFGDMLPSEFKTRMNSLKLSKGTRNSVDTFGTSGASLPESIDWREKGVVTPVKDQGNCGSCWAFSTTGSLEGQHALKTGKLVSFSEQNLIDCSTENDGCGGGDMDIAFEYIQSNGGLDTESSYPYTASEGTCAYNASYSGGTDSGFVDVTSGDETALKEAVGIIGPISVAIDASSILFQFYSSGIYEPLLGCSPIELDHGVLVVGYGSEGGRDYWLVKNSWGTTWGEEGYIKMRRNYNNECGIATMPSYPVVS